MPCVKKYLKKVFFSPSALEFWEVLQYPFTRSSEGGLICDIQDGSKYKHLQKPGKFLSYPEHTGLILNTDGVAIFKSAKHSLWPICLSVTNLPPHLRMRKDFILLAGIWFGPTKPKMSVILEPILAEIMELNILGTEVETTGGKKTIRTKLILSVFDLPAKCTAVNMKQFNGRYGCLYCNHPGESLMKGCTIYRPGTSCELRTHESVNRHAEEALKSGEAAEGIKGYSILSKYIDVVDDIPIDYMHAVLEGVVKQITGMWFNSKHHKSSFYIGNRVKEVDRMLVKIKPPSHFRRSPRPVATTLKFWKANEYRAWLLFYSMPIVEKFLPSEYVHHWSLLVWSMHILTSSAIEVQLLPIVDQAIDTFYALIPNLYGLQVCTANIHSLTHLTGFVKKWGPLWAYSLFGFENMNGHIRKTFHGTRQIVDQLVFCVKAEQSLYFQIKNQPTVAMDFLSSYNKDYNSSLHFEGKSKKVPLPKAIHDALQNFTGGVLNGQRIVVSRLRKNCIVFQSEFFVNQNRVTDSSVCSFRKCNGEVGLARILVFDAALKVAVIRPYQVLSETVPNLRVARTQNLKTACQKISLKDYFSVVTPLPNSSLIVLPITDILSPCVSISLPQSKEILVFIPNDYELH